MKKILLFAVLSLTVLSLSLGQGYKITVKVNGLSEDTLLLGYYYGKYQYVRDTVALDKFGKGVFETKDTVGGGIYFIVMPNKNFIEFVLDKEREFSIEADTADLVKSVKAKGSADNTSWFAYKVFIADRGAKIDALGKTHKRLQDAGKEDSVKILEQQMKDINTEVADYKNKFIKNNPKSLVSRIFDCSREPEIPETPVLPNGRKDSTFAYRYFRAHFWDMYDFTDDRLLRTPIYHAKLDQYLTKVVPQIPDTLIAEIDVIIEKTRPNKEVFKYTVWYLTHYYETSQVMGMDAVFVFLADKVYRPGDAFWVSDNVNKKILEHADKLKPNLIGKVAPELILLGLDNQLISMHSIPATYTILYFWDPSCGHCKTETPKLVDYYNKVKDTMDMKVYSVCSDTNLTAWRNYVTEKKMEAFINVNGTRTAKGNFHDLYDIFSTPVVYILDSKKRIIGKKIPVDQIANFLAFYRKHPTLKD